MQRVVFNANYLAYVDDAVDTWMRSALSDRLAHSPDPSNLHSIGFDAMVKTATITWKSPVVFPETVDLVCSVGRWGTTSFDVHVLGLVDEMERFTCVVTYVSVDPRNQRPVEIPDIVRTALGFTPSS